jgi:hypothetical protein
MSLVISCDPSVKFCAFSVFENNKLVDVCKIKSTFKDLQVFFEGKRRVW